MRLVIGCTIGGGWDLGGLYEVTVHGLLSAGTVGVV